MKRLEDYPLTLKEAAHQLGCSSNAIRRFVAAGKLRAEEFGPLGDMRFRQVDVEEFVSKIDSAKLNRQLVQRIRAMEPHYQGTLKLPNR